MDKLRKGKAFEKPSSKKRKKKIKAIYIDKKRREDE